MLDRLQHKWKVGGIQLVLILCTFALGGSLTGYAAKKIMNLLPLEKNPLWVIIYIILVTLLWPIAVVLVSVFFGQYRFFLAYLRKMGVRTRLLRPLPDNKPAARKLAIFASGAGSNARKIIEYFRHNPAVEISLIVCNKPGAGVLAIAHQEKIPVLLIEKEQFFRGNAYVDELKTAGIDFIVLAGFLWKIPAALVQAWPRRIVNIHPALLPAYGGKGMYGHFVHEAVISAGEKQSGITIHYVDEHYDNGAIIFQATTPITSFDTPETLAKKIHELEHAHFPRVIENVLLPGVPA
ncbi:MAG: phosphoribosylglycinamide formyltransferase [Chitinophagaceae bacterium]